MCCISPVLAAKVLGDVGLTLGKKGDEATWPYQGSIDASEALGAKIHQVANPEVCNSGLLHTVPAFMEHTASIDKIAEGIDTMVASVVKAIKK